MSSPTGETPATSPNLRASGEEARRWCCLSLGIAERELLGRMRLNCATGCAWAQLLERRADTALRCAQLRLNADVLSEYMDGWLSAQLRDLADLLEQREAWLS